ncbi:uncharacterized protein LOC117101421 [Anneissia japonica]|uniref:uncharacterized protein LOC117101421 n=1 Tax=Anneissia japonica TaxID=1529436 RepID=UPI001425505D|nr:uncharacterized protein LOC117101421 [Anneissia japonica]
MDLIDNNSSAEDVKTCLIDCGIPENDAKIIEENGVDGEILFHLKDEDLKSMLPGRVGIVRKIKVLLQARKTPDLEIQEFSVPSGSSEEEEAEWHLSTSSAGTECPLPIYSTRVRGWLSNSVDASKHLDKIIEETAYHIIAHKYNMKSKTQYEVFGKSLVAEHPNLAFSSGSSKWRVVTQKLSQKLRNIRWRENKRIKKTSKGDKRKPGNGARSYICLPKDSDNHKSFEEIEEELKVAVVAEDGPRIKKLLRDSFQERRDVIRKLNGGAKEILERFPLLKESGHVIAEFERMVNENDYCSKYLEFTVITFHSYDSSHHSSIPDLLDLTGLILDDNLLFSSRGGIDTKTAYNSNSYLASGTLAACVSDAFAVTMKGLY